MDDDGEGADAEGYGGEDEVFEVEDFALEGVYAVEGACPVESGEGVEEDGEYPGYDDGDEEGGGCCA